MLPSAHDWLDAQRSQIQSDLTELCNMNSGSSNLSGLHQVADWLQSWFEVDQTVATRIKLEPRTEITDQGVPTEVETGPILRWDSNIHAKKRVLLAIHYDTVYGASHPFQSCTLLNEDRLGGPGVADAKGGIVLLRYALKAFEKFRATHDIGWSVVLNPDEEVGSPSSTAYFNSIAKSFDFGLLFEPSLPTGELVAERKGSGNYDIVVSGRSAHAGRHFEDGRNAVAMVSQLLCQLHDLNGKRDGLTVNVGYVNGGGPVNIVPQQAIGRFNVRMTDQASAEWFDSELKTLVNKANQVDGFQVSSHGAITSPPKQMTTPMRDLMVAVEETVAALTSRTQLLPVKWKKTGGVCDGNKLAAAGLTNIDTMGPCGDGLHSSNEWVQISSIAEKAKVLVDLLARFEAGQLPEFKS